MTKEDWRWRCSAHTVCWFATRARSRYLNGHREQGMTFRKGIISVRGVFDLGERAHGHVNSAESSFRTSCARAAPAQILSAVREDKHTQRERKRER